MVSLEDIFVLVFLLLNTKISFYLLTKRERDVLKDTPSINKPRKSMAKVEVCSQDVQNEINALQSFRSGWANDIREGWNFSTPEAKEVLLTLYEVAGDIVLALQQVQEGHYRDKMAMLLVQKRLEKVQLYILIN